MDCARASYKESRDERSLIEGKLFCSERRLFNDLSFLSYNIYKRYTVRADHKAGYCFLVTRITLLTGYGVLVAARAMLQCSQVVHPRRSTTVSDLARVRG